MEEKKKAGPTEEGSDPGSSGSGASGVSGESGADGGKDKITFGVHGKCYLWAS